MNRLRASSRRRMNRLSVEALEGRQLLATFSVTSNADSGPGTLRDAITQANAASGSDLITFAIPGAGVHAIVPTSPMPNVSDPLTIDASTQPGYAGTPLIELNGSNIFDTSTPPAAIPNVNGLNLTAGASVVKGFAVNRFTGYGVAATGDGNTIVADFIGTNPTGTISLKNQSGGISLASRNNSIGGATAAERNVISGNGGDGITIAAIGTQVGNNLVQGNLIGTDITGTLDLGNVGNGVFANSGGNLVGGSTPAAGNIIAYNGAAGVQIGTSNFGNPITGNTVTMNSIFSDVGLGIDYGSPGVSFNAPQQFPNINSVYQSGGQTIVEGTLTGVGSSPILVEFYGNSVRGPSGYGEGKTFLGSTFVTTNVFGSASFTFALPAPLATGQFLTATATAFGSTSEFSQAVAVSATSQADVTISGYTNNFNAQTGQLLTYTLFVTNNGPSRARSVVLNDDIPPGSQYSSSTTSVGTIPAGPVNGRLTFPLGDLEVGQTATITITVQPTLVGTATNIATVSAVNDSNLANNQFVTSTQIIPTPPADLAILGASSPNPSVVGGELTYLFVVQNTSYQTSATGVVVTDTLPAGLTFLRARSSQGGVTVAGNTITANLGTLLPAANATVTIIVSPTVAGLISNAASVRGNELDPNSLNNDVVVSTTVNAAPPADLAVAITAAPQPAQVGLNFTYAVLVVNKGPALATNVVLTDDLPDAASIVSIKPSQGTATVTDGVITMQLGTLPVGATAVLTVVLRPGAAGTLESRADVTADQPDFNIADNTSILDVTAVGDQAPPTVTNQKLILGPGAKTIAAVVVTFSQALDPVLAANPANYRIYALGKDSKLPVEQGTLIEAASAVYNPVMRSVTITPKTKLTIGQFYKLVLNGPGAPGITDVAGNVLDGDRNGLPDGIYESLIGRGTHERPNALQRGIHKAKPKPHPVVHHPVARSGKHTTVNVVVNN